MTEFNQAVKEHEEYQKLQADEEYRNKKLKLGSLSRKQKLKIKKNRSNK